MVYNSINEIVVNMKAQLSRRDVLERAIVRIYRNQTADEKRVEATTHYNGIGFTGADAKFLSSLATWVNRGKHLTDKQAYVANKKMQKYARQLVMGSIDEGKIVKVNGKYATGADIAKLQSAPKAVESLDIDNYDGVAEDIYWSNKFAEQEREQEARAYANMKW